MHDEFAKPALAVTSKPRQQRASSADGLLVRLEHEDEARHVEQQHGAGCSANGKKTNPAARNV
jgi:hypothetical protein